MSYLTGQFSSERSLMLTVTIHVDVDTNLMFRIAMGARETERVLSFFHESMSPWWLLLNIDTTALPAFNLVAFRQLWVKLVSFRIEPGAS